MVESNKINVKLTNTQLKKLKAAVKNSTGTTLRISLKIFDGNDLPHELLLTTRPKNKAKKCNWTRIHNHFVRKQTLNHLAKLTK